MPYCTVCKFGSDFLPAQEEIEEAEEDWIPTSNRTSVTQAQIIFKLFEVLKVEFPSGSVCADCHGLLEQIDSLEFQLKALTKALKDRIDSGLEEEEEVEVKKRKKVKKVEFEEDEDLEDEAKNNDFWNSIQNRDSIRTYLDSDQVDYNISTAATQRGEEQLMFRGYTYKKNSHQPKLFSDGRGIIKWKCSNYYAKKGRCRAKIATTADGLTALLDSLMDHNHPADPNVVKIILFRERVKEIAINHPDMKASEILASAEMLMENPTSLGLKDQSLLRYVQRIRTKQMRGTLSSGNVKTEKKNRNNATVPKWRRTLIQQRNELGLNSDGTVPMHELNQSDMETFQQQEMENVDSYSAENSAN